jgi:protein TonB
MDALEKQLRRCSRSVPAFLGAALTSAALFFAMGSSNLVRSDDPKPEEPPLTYALTPPPPPEPERKTTTPPLASSLAEAFKFDPTTAGPPPEIPLDLLDIKLSVDVDPGLAVAVDMQRTFEVQKPESPNRYIIYEREQVDEIPVWLYGPQPRVPREIEGTVSNVHVFFVVTDKGRTEHIFVLAADHEQFGENVREAIADFRFRPGRKNGKPVRVRVQQTFNTKAEFKSPFSL